MAAADEGEERQEVIRLCIDHDSSRRSAVPELRRLGLEVLTTLEANNDRSSDMEQLQFATANGWSIYTATVRDFARLHRDWLRENRSHGGIIVRFNQQMPVGEQLRRLLDISANLEQPDMANRLISLDTWEVA